jgi:hypothetical protein
MPRYLHDPLALCSTRCLQVRGQVATELSFHDTSPTMRFTRLHIVRDALIFRLPLLWVCSTMDFKSRGISLRFPGYSAFVVAVYLSVPHLVNGHFCSFPPMDLRSGLDIGSTYSRVRITVTLHHRVVDAVSDWIRRGSTTKLDFPDKR